MDLKVSKELDSISRFDPAMLLSPKYSFLDIPQSLCNFFHLDTFKKVMVKLDHRGVQYMCDLHFVCGPLHDNVYEKIWNNEIDNRKYYIFVI